MKTSARLASVTLAEIQAVATAVTVDVADGTAGVAVQTVAGVVVQTVAAPVAAVRPVETVAGAVVQTVALVAVDAAVKAPPQHRRERLGLPARAAHQHRPMELPVPSATAIAAALAEETRRAAKRALRLRPPNSRTVGRCGV